MPYTSTVQARDEILTMFWDAWRASAAAAAGGLQPDVVWRQVEQRNTVDVVVGQGGAMIAWQAQGQRPRSDLPWARASVQHNFSTQRTLGTTGNRRFERTGNVIIQLFNPRSVEQGMRLPDALADIAVRAYEGNAAPNGAWFRDVRYQEIGFSEPWFQVNVIADFVYEMVR